MNKLANMAKGNLHSNSWKAVLVLYRLKTYNNVFFDLEGKCASFREKLSRDYYYKIVMLVETGMYNCLKNNDIYNVQTDA